MADEALDAEDRKEQLRRIVADYQRAKEAGETLPLLSALEKQHPTLADELCKAIAELEGKPVAELRRLRRGNGPSTNGVPAEIPGYVVQGELARGGMGVVLAAYDTALEREVAIKVPLSGLGATERAIARFRDESKITAALPHPGVPPVHNIGTLPDGRPYLVMKLVRGRTLADLLAGRALAELPRWLHVFEQVCRTVGFAHSQRIIHRDLKPANVMVGAFGEVQVMDWGLAKVLKDDEAAPHAPDIGPRHAGGPLDRTRAGSVMGTPAYMPPEQARGDIAAVGPAADVFALGAILCKILTGYPPYGLAHADVLLKRAAAGDIRVARELLDRCGAPEQLVAVARICLQPDPSHRPPDGNEVAGLIAAYRSTEEQRAAQVILAAAETRSEAIRRAARKEGDRTKQWAWMTYGVITLLGIIGAIVKCNKGDSNSTRSYAPGPSYSASPGVENPLHRFQADRWKADQQVPPVEQFRPGPSSVPRDEAKRAGEQNRSQGRTALQNGAAQDAVVYFHRALRADPTPADYAELSAALVRTGQATHALGYARKAAELAPDDAAIRVRLGQALVAAGERSEAIPLLTRLIEQASKNVDVYQALAEALAGEGRWAEAADTATNAFKADLGEAARFDRGLRYPLAVAAARAAAADSTAEKDRGRYRQRAFAALSAELAVWRKLAEHPVEKSRRARVLSGWLEEPAFSALRGEEALARLPEAEHGKWRDFWSEVEQAAGRTSSPEPSTRQRPSKP